MSTITMPARDSGERCYAVLLSIHFVLKAEQLLKGQGLLHDVVPVPRAISADCGMAIEFPCQEAGAVTALLAAADIEITRLYRRTAGGDFAPLTIDNG